MLAPQQVSGLESLLVPPLAAAKEWVTGTQSHAPIRFGAQLTAALERAAAGSSGSATGVQTEQRGRILQQALQQHTQGGTHKAAAAKQYLVLVTGSGRKVQHYLVAGVSSAFIPLSAATAALILCLQPGCGHLWA